MVSSVLASLTLPAKIRLRLGKPLTSRTRPKVTNGQSLRFSFERPRLAFSMSQATPSKQVFVRSYSVIVSVKPNKDCAVPNRWDSSASRCLRSVSALRSELLQAHPLIVVTDQFSQRRSLSQPVMGRQLAGRRRHAADHIPHGCRDLGLVEPEFRQLVFKPELAQHRERGMLDPDTPRPHKVQRAQIHFLETFRRGRFGFTASIRFEPLPGDELCRVPLGL